VKANQPTHRGDVFDWIVVGAGGAGSATTYALAKRGFRILSLERFYENHPFGSSHGGSRILRTAYSEGPEYVPLVLKARGLWKELARLTHTEIFRPTGVLVAGLPESPMVSGALRSARIHRRPHSIFDSGELSAKFRPFRLDPDEIALWDPGGGVVFPERAVHAFVQLARLHGARFHWRERVDSWRTKNDLVEVRTPRTTYTARGMVACGGPWLPTLFPELSLPLEIELQSVFWFRPPRRDSAVYRTMPAFVWQQRDSGYFYGIPELGQGVKVASDRGFLVRSLERVSRQPRGAELRLVQNFTRSHLIGLPKHPIRAITCLYTNTPDRDFIIDHHPDHGNVILVSACSGHGFKFMSAIGSEVARMAVSGHQSRLFRPFAIRRYSRRRPIPTVPP
jgi:monomeric sarcosine oxidase